MTRAARPPRIPDPIAALIDDRLIGARCAGKSPLFDTELDDETAEERSDRLTWARGQCTRCPVRGACREAALEQGEPQGLWGGVPFGEPRRPGREAA